MTVVGGAKRCPASIAVTSLAIVTAPAIVTDGSPLLGSYWARAVGGLAFYLVRPTWLVRWLSA